MKKIILIVGLLTIISAQAATISVKAISAVETRIDTQRKDFAEKTSYAVGNRRFVAVTSYQIEALLLKAQEMLDALILEPNLTELEISERVKDIESFLSTSANLIYQLPY